MKILSVSSIQRQMRLFELFLPDDIVFQILARLPLESLIRFRCVCKSWHKLLSDKYFIQLHNDLSPHTKQLVLLLNFAPSTLEDYIMGLVDNWRRCYYSGLSLDFLSEKVNVEASCNGLLCCVTITDPARYYICNPLTREFKFIFQGSPYDNVILVVDPRSQRYHVVLDDPWACNSIRNLLIFYSGTGEWKTLVSDLGESRVVPFGVGRSFYMIARLSSDIKKLIAFDLYDEVWRTMSPPFNLNYAKYLNEFEGSLSVITISECLMDIWVLKDEKSHEEWALVESIVISQKSKPRPIAINRDFILLNRSSSIWVYCRRNKTWRKVHDIDSTNADILPWELAFRTTLCSC